MLNILAISAGIIFSVTVAMLLERTGQQSIVCSPGKPPNALGRPIYTRSDE